MESSGKSEIADVGVDWLTFTVGHGQPELPELKELWELHQEAEVKIYGEGTKTAPQGYHGFKTRHFFYGERKDGFIFQATSGAAKEAAAIARRIGRNIRPTRVDYQVTLREPHRDNRAFSRYRDECRDREARAGKTARIATTLYESDIRGDSITFGGAGNKRTLTIYDKSAESRGALEPNLTRYELRVRHQQARATFAQLQKSADIAIFSKSIVSDMMRRIGFPVDWPDVDASVSLPSSYEKTDDERRVDWLLSQVVPIAAKIQDQSARRELARAFRDALM